MAAKAFLEADRFTDARKSQFRHAAIQDEIRAAETFSSIAFALHLPQYLKLHPYW